MTRLGIGGVVQRESAGALALLAAIPFLFLHERYQPTATVDVSSTTVDLRLSDAAVLLVLLAALFAVGRSSGRLNVLGEERTKSPCTNKPPHSTEGRH